VHFTFKF